MPNALDITNCSDLQMQLYHQHNQPSTPTQLTANIPIASDTTSVFSLMNSMTSVSVNPLLNNSLVSSNSLLNQQPNTMTTTTSNTNVNSVLNAQLNALGLTNLNGFNGLNNLSNLGNLTSLANLANLENTGDYQNTLLNQLSNQQQNSTSNLLNRTNGTSLDSLISSADSLSPSNSAHNITTIANSLHNSSSKMTHQNKNAQIKLNQQNAAILAAAASNGQASPNLINELLNYYDLKKMYENMPLNALYPALFGSSPLLRDQHTLAYKQTLQGKIFSFYVPISFT